MRNNKIDKAIAKYQVAINKNISESEVQWSRYNSLLVFNSILIAAIGLTYQADTNLPWPITVFLPIAGLITCYLWFSMTYRGFKWMNIFISSAREIEGKYLKDDDLERNPILNGNDHRKKDMSWLRTEMASKIIIGLIAILYLIFLFYSLKIDLFYRKNHQTRQETNYLQFNYVSAKTREEPSQYSQTPQNLYSVGDKSILSWDIFGIILSAFSGGLFAGIWTNYFESRRRMNELRRSKYYDHRNTIVQLEHESIPLRINLSRNITSLENTLKETNDNNIQVVLRLYKMFISPGLSLKLLNLDLINEYSELYILLESINSDIQYLESVVNNIRENFNNGKVDESMLRVYIALIDHLYKMCKKTDKESLTLLSKCKIIIRRGDEKTRKKYIKDGNEIIYTMTNREILKEDNKTIREETRPGGGQGKEQFVAPYMNLKRQ